MAFAGSLGWFYPVRRKKYGLAVLPLSQELSDDAAAEGGRATTLNTGILVGSIQGRI